MEIPPGAFDLAVEAYRAALERETEGGSLEALLELEAMDAWIEQREAAVAEAWEAAWDEGLPS